MNNTAQFPGLLNECLVTQSRNAARRLTRLYNRQLTSVDLKSQQVSLLYFLYQRPLSSTADLTDCLAIERSAVARNLAVLETRELIQSDKKGRGLLRRYQLSPGGEVLLTSLSGAWHDAQRDVRDQVGEEGWVTIHKAFKLLSTLNI
ncbi:helix-turn-helix domain-containing protein [Reinekea sp.]|jgi:DNA-binding MarR family transcriptional regulator|uniref:MarR family winged helix-turn-helix transcriptional regulator n=1 Tax=Reinekea sp. TaxID=1970455 RepID=UPI002A817956|nr:helix-turn-helix domain-containing protein [Reinekea sp.]